MTIDAQRPTTAATVARANLQGVLEQSTAPTVGIALGKDPREAGTPVENRLLSLAEIVGLLTRHERRADKMGRYFCAPMRDGRRNADSAMPWRLFALDFDGVNDAPDLDKSRACFADAWHVGYTTHSYTPENGKHRIVLLLSREVTSVEHRELFHALADRLPFAPDPKLNHPTQPVFLPSCPPEATPSAWVNDGEPLDVDGVLAAHRRAAEAESCAQAAYQAPAGNDSVIGAFNAAHELTAILEQHGYVRRGRKYLHPRSESGIPSVSILADGRLCFSHSSSDPLGDGMAHDAFDTWAILTHGGDKRAATRAAAELLGLAKPLRAAGTASAPAPDELPDPLPLPKLPPVPDFPLDILPDDLRDWVADAADRARFRPEFAAVAGMAALGSVIGRKVGIRLKAHDDWTEFANVWGMVVGSPSSLKSPAMRDALRPFKALQATADERHAAAMREHAAQSEGHKLRRDAKRKAAAKALAKNLDAEVDLDLPPPEAPVSRTYWTSDATAERLGELLAENPTGLLVERDELSSLLVSLEDERQATARGLYLSGWSGQEGYRFDRIMRGTTTLPKFALSVVGGIQPGPLARYVRGAFSGERADGLLQRFQLLVWPDPEPFVLVDRPPNQSAREKAGALFAFADALDGDAVGIRPKFGNEPPFVRLSAEAQAIFAEWYTEFMLNRRASEAGGESAALGAHFGKYPGLLGKLCLILHVADEPDAPAVSERTLLKGLAWLDYLTPHARRAYHAVDKPETGAAELLLARLRRGELPPLFKAWELSRKCWHGLGEREVVRSACRLLLEFGWLVEADPGGATGGRPSDPIYAVSPKARGWA